MLILEKTKVIKYETNISSNDSHRSKKIVFSLNREECLFVNDEHKR